MADAMGRREFLKAAALGTAGMAAAGLFGTSVFAGETEAVSGETFTEGLLRCGTVAEAVEAYTAAEHRIISGYGFVPLFYKNTYLVAEKDNEDIIYDPFTGAVDYRNAKNYGE